MVPATLRAASSPRSGLLRFAPALWVTRPLVARNML